MNLTTALRIGSTPRLALVGGGGKTTTMFTLARERSSPVIVASTAHMAIEQLTLADQHFFVSAPADLAACEPQLPAGITFFTGSENTSGKTIGLTPETARAVCDLADRHHAPLFIEADGSKCLPLKAPAEHEPPIPDFVDTVIYVVGLSGLGQPLDAEHVHRPERFARLSGLAIGDAVTPEAIAKVLRDPIGGLKNVPPTARRIALLNQADTPDLQAQAQVIARQLLPAYHAVGITALKYQQVFAVHEPTAGVILAAGASTRMGQPKPLLTWRGEPFIRHVARTALGAGLITGRDRDGRTHIGDSRRGGRLAGDACLQSRLGSGAKHFGALRIASAAGHDRIGDLPAGRSAAHPDRVGESPEGSARAST